MATMSLLCDQSSFWVSVTCCPKPGKVNKVSRVSRLGRLSRIRRVSNLW
jgi:hypothetical protein